MAGKQNEKDYDNFIRNLEKQLNDSSSSSSQSSENDEINSELKKPQPQKNQHKTFQNVFKTRSKCKYENVNNNDVNLFHTDGASIMDGGGESSRENNGRIVSKNANSSPDEISDWDDIDNSSDDDDDDDGQYEKVQVDESTKIAIQQDDLSLQSLGSVTPLLYLVEEPSEEEDSDEVQMELVSDDTNYYRNDMQAEKLPASTFFPNHPEQSYSDDINFDYEGLHDVSSDLRFMPEFVDPTLGLIAPATNKSNTAIGKVLKNVKSQLSLTNLKRMGKQASNQAKRSFSKTMLDLNNPDAYPRKPDTRMLRVLKGDRKVSSDDLPNVAAVACSNLVEPFPWNPLIHTDPEFKTKNVEYETFLPELNLKPSSSHEFMLPNCTVSAPFMDEKLSHHQFVGQLGARIQKEYESTKAYQKPLWDKAIKYGVHHLSKDFRRIFMYISSKVEFADSFEILTLKYCNANDILALGSHNGILKLIQFKDAIQTSPIYPEIKDITSIIVRNESLKGHTDSVLGLEWINCFNDRDLTKLMSIDAQGVIIGWNISEIPGNQKVAFIQDQSYSIILGFGWSPESTRVCIIYSDVGQSSNTNNSSYGLVVGTSDGNREWSTSLPDSSPPQAVTWLDETKFLLVQDNIITVNCCCTGQKMQTRNFKEEDQFHGLLGKLISLLVKPSTAWKNTGSFEIGLIWEHKIALLQTVDDTNALVFDPQIICSCSAWSPNGLYVGVGGTKLNGEQLSAQVNIYNCSGKLLTILKIDQPSIANISWDADSSNLAMGSNNLLHVATVRPVYKFSSNGTIHAYAFAVDSENFIAFWDKSNINIQKVDGKVVDLKNHGDRFALLSMNLEGIYCVTILSKTGVCIDALVILIGEPFLLCLTDVCLICLSATSLLFWRYNSSLSQLSFDDANVRSTSKDGSSSFMRNSKVNSVRQIHIDDVSFITPKMDFDLKNSEDIYKATLDVAVCMDAKFDRLCVARFSGKLQIYCLPQGGLLHTVEVPRFSPFQILLNPTGTKMALLDMNGSIRFGHVEDNGTKIKVDSDVLSSGILNMLWSKDMPDFLCVMKRTEMCIIRHANFETFANFHALSGYLAGFNNLTITLLKLNEILDNPTQPNNSHVVEVDMQILEFLRQCLQSGDKNQTSYFIENVKRIDHPRLWNVLGEEELKLQNYEGAQFAFIHSRNYPALQFLKRIDTFPPHLQAAEISAFLGEYENASKLFMASKRTDLALDIWRNLDDAPQLRRLLGQFESLGHTMKPTIEHSLKKAEEYLNDGEVSKAIPIFEGLKQYDRVFDCYMMIDDCSELKALSQKVPKDDILRQKIAEQYGFIGMTAEAVEIYLESGTPNKAVDIALTNMECSLALEIALEYDIPMVAKSILELTKQLLSSGDIMRAVEFLRKCGKPFAAGKLLATTALRELQSNNTETSLMNIKKMFVMAATFLQKRNSSSTFKSRTRARTKSKHFKLVDDDIKLDESIPVKYQPTMEEERWMKFTPYRGAMAIHYFILMQRRIHIQNFDKATELSTHLRSYSDILGVERVNCIIGLASAHAKKMVDCIGALSQLENIDESYGQLAKELLTASDDGLMCWGADLSCGDSSNNSCSKSSVPFCIINGNVLKAESIWTCGNCLGPASKKKIQRYNHCPLCHEIITIIK